MTIVRLDTETFSRTDIKRGYDSYMRDPSFRVLIATYTVDDQPAQLWSLAEKEPWPVDLTELFKDPNAVFVMHNAPFDRNALRYGGIFNLPIRSTRCTVAQAYSHSLPGALDALGTVLGLPLEKQKILRGHDLIQLFCKPQAGGKIATHETHPAEWKEFLEYALRDAEALREVHKRLPTYNYSGEHLELWFLDQEINERGFKCDMQLADAAVRARDAKKLALDAEIERMTDGAISKGTQRQRFHEHFVGESGLLLLDLKKDTLERLLKRDDLDPVTRRLVEIRMQSSMTSLAKYERAQESVGPDHRMRHSMQFGGANRTGRWAGRVFQPHNLPRPNLKLEYIVDTLVPAIKDGTIDLVHENVNEACANCLRSTIISEEGKELLVADWSNIEGRVLAWLADEKWKLRAFNEYDAGTGPDTYIKLYASSFNVPLETVDDKKRQMGKVMDLSMGFAGGVGAFKNAAETYRMDLDELGRVVPAIAPPEILKKAETRWEEQVVIANDQGLEPAAYIACDALKQIWRKSHPAVVQMWYDTERAVRNALMYPGSVQHAARCKIWLSGIWLNVQLPSGRKLLYCKPKLAAEAAIDEETGEILEIRSVISYMAARGKSWRRERTYSGKLVENIVQAVANDVLRASMLKAKCRGFSLVLHVHDEIVAEEVTGTRQLEELYQLMTEPLPWSEGLPLAVAGYAADRYRKD